MGSAGKRKNRKNREDRRKVGVPGSGAPGSRKVAIKGAAVELTVNRTSPIRSAAERCLAALHRKRLEAELAAGSAANAPLDRRIASEFALVDYETL